MEFYSSYLTSDGDGDQETLKSAEEEAINHLLLLSEDGADDHLPLIKRKRIKIHSDTKRLKLIREKFLKRPILHPDANDPIPEFDLPPPPATVFDTETESDSSDSDYQAALAMAAPPQSGEIDHQELADNIPEEYKKLMNFMGGSTSARPNLVLEKRLRKGDVDERRNRFLIRQSKMRANFLEVEEEDKLNMEKWWTVEIIEPDCSVSLITLSKWETGKGPAYVLITEWNALVERNELKEGDLMQLWSFRAHGGGVGVGVGGGNGDGDGGDGGRGRLCFMLLEIYDGDEEDDRFGPLESSG